MLKPFPTDVGLTPAVSCRQKSKITENGKENAGYVPYVVFLVTYIRRKYPNRSVWMSLIMNENSSLSILYSVLNKTLKQAPVAWMMNMYCFILKVMS